MRQADLDFCYLTTIGRKSGRARTIEIWFGLEGKTVYFLSGGGDSAQWVRNLQANAQVTIKLGRRKYLGKARLVSDKDENAKARRLLAAKYEAWEPGRRLSSWARNSLTVAVDLASKPA